MRHGELVHSSPTLRNEQPTGEATPEVVAFVRRATGLARRIAGPCIGALVLAEAGLLDCRRATTHWMYARDMAARYPRVKVEEDRIFIADEPVRTSAGMTVGIDLALALIEGSRASLAAPSCVPSGSRRR
jgi:transcriptional regulator GlxA family with amidase domain